MTPAKDHNQLDEQEDKEHKGEGGKENQEEREKKVEDKKVMEKGQRRRR